MCLIFAATLLLCVAAPVLAEETRRTDLSFTLEAAEPSYTVTIPAYFGDFTYVSRESGWHAPTDEYYEYDYYSTSLMVSASNAENLNGRKITITFEGSTLDDEGQFCLKNTEAVANGYSPHLYYSLHASPIVHHVFVPHGYSLGDKIVTFIDNDTCFFIANAYLFVQGTPIKSFDNLESDIMPNSPYTGYIIFGIKLVEVS